MHAGTQGWGWGWGWGGMFVRFGVVKGALIVGVKHVGVEGQGLKC